MILSGQEIKRHIKIRPFKHRTIVEGMSYGLSSAGYDLRIQINTPFRNNYHLLSPGAFLLATTVESIALPDNVMGMLVDKSTWARQALSVFNTVFEPGWHGFPTIELVNLGEKALTIPQNAPIAQMVFMYLNEPAKAPYDGKYQGQKQEPVSAILEK